VAVSPLVDPTDSFDRALAAGVLTVSLLLSLLFFWLMSALTTVERGRVELAKRNREAALLTSLGEDLHSCLTVKEAHEVLTKHMPQILPGTAAVLYAFDAAHARATEARWGSPRSLQDEFAPQSCQAIRRGHPYHVADSTKGLNCAHFIGGPANTYVCVPLNAQGELIGMLHVQASAQTALGDSEVNLIKAAAQHLSLALANLGLREKLVEQATRDNLTGLYNRHYMRDWLAHELLRAARHQRSIGVIMLDVDHFKRVNDVFGHEAGDLVLRELAGVMRRLARGSDVICRQGGEEFLLLLPEAPADATLAKAEELRAQVAALKLEYAGQALGTVTISLGVAAFPRDGADMEALLRSADAALYAAKRSGRNRTVVASGKAGVMHDRAAVAPVA
jgi:diguanylate cyclase (GGDEF)-like protein